MSVLNVFKTSVDTINASSITSDMTIGANLNGGSLTIGGSSINIGKVNSVTNFSSGTINASNFKLYSTIDVYNQSAWLDTIGTTITPQLVLGYNNASQVYLGSPNTPLIIIGGDKGTVKIANDGLVAGARISIATGTNNVGNSQVTIGSSTLSTVLLNGVNVVMNDQTGSKVQIGGKDMGVMYLRAATLYINDGNNSDYINNGNTIIGNSYGTGYSYIKGSTVGIGDDRGDIYIGSNDPVPGKTSKLYIRTPIRPQYTYSTDLNTIGGRYDNGGIGGALITIYGDGNWRNYLYCNDVPPGIYLFQYWANPGGMTYTNMQQRIHLSPNAFTGNSNVIWDMLILSQSYINPVPGLYSSVAQTSIPYTIAVDSSRPHVCFAMLCNTNVNAGTYHGLTLTRIA